LRHKERVEELVAIDLLNISGPYGAGKDTLLRAVLDNYGGRVHRVSTLTTRLSSAAADPSYTSLTPEEFAKATEGSNWIVNCQLSGTVAYATDLKEIDREAAAGKLCVHSIYAGDAGAGELRRRLGARVMSVGVLVDPGGVANQLATLRRRLIARAREDSVAMEQRLLHQHEAVSYVLANPEVVANDGQTYYVFDRKLVNDDLGRAISEILEIAATAYGRRADARTPH
jgi:guanylate kinase